MLIHEKRALPVFTVAVSLGGDCVPSDHLRNHKIPVISSPFDWIFTSATGLLTLIERDFDGFLDPSMLFLLVRKEEICFVGDRRYGCVFAHDFTIGQPLDDPTVRAKFDHKIDNFRRVLTSQSPVLFVRHIMGRGDAERFAILMGRLWPQLNWHLLVVNDSPEPDWGLAWATNKHMDPSIPYPGDPDAWSWAIAEFTFAGR